MALALPHTARHGTLHERLGAGRPRDRGLLGRLSGCGPTRLARRAVVWPACTQAPLPPHPHTPTHSASRDRFEAMCTTTSVLQAHALAHRHHHWRPYTRGAQTANMMTGGGRQGGSRFQRPLAQQGAKAACPLLLCPWPLPLPCPAHRHAQRAVPPEVGGVHAAQHAAQAACAPAPARQAARQRPEARAHAAGGPGRAEGAGPGGGEGWRGVGWRGVGTAPWGCAGGAVARRGNLHATWLVGARGQALQGAVPPTQVTCFGNNARVLPPTHLHHSTASTPPPPPPHPVG